MITKRAVLFDVDDTLSCGADLNDQTRYPLFEDTMRNVFNEILSNPENTVVIYSRYTTVEQIKSLLPEGLVDHKRITLVQSSESRVEYFTNYLRANKYESGIIVDDAGLEVKDKKNIVHIQVPYMNNGSDAITIKYDSYLKMATLPMSTLFEIKDKIERQKETIGTDFRVRKTEAAENLNTLYHDTIVHYRKAYLNVKISSATVLDILNDKSFRSTSHNPARKFFSSVSPGSRHGIANKELRGLHQYLKQSLEKNETITLSKLANALEKLKSPLLKVLEESIYFSSLNPEQAKSQAEYHIISLAREVNNNDPENSVDKTHDDPDSSVGSLSLS